MTGTKSMAVNTKDAGGLRRQRVDAEHASRPGRVIPCGVAPQQSSTGASPGAFQLNPTGATRQFR